jgi:hypothetical protein
VDWFTTEDEDVFAANSSVVHTVKIQAIATTKAALKGLSCHPRVAVKEASADAEGVVVVNESFVVDASVAKKTKATASKGKRKRAKPKPKPKPKPK